MNDDSKGVSKQNTIDNLLNEMHANAAEAMQEAEQSQNSATNLVLSQAEFGEHKAAASPMDKQSIKEIRGIVQTFDHTEMSVLLSQVEKELNSRAHNDNNDSPGTARKQMAETSSDIAKLTQIKNLQERLEYSNKYGMASTFDPLTVDKNLDPKKRIKMLDGMEK